MLVERRVRVPERVALVVEAAPLVDQDVSCHVEISCVEELGMAEAPLLAEERGSKLEVAEEAAEGDVGHIVQRGMAEETDGVLVERCHDVPQRAVADGARE